MLSLTLPTSFVLLCNALGLWIDVELLQGLPWDVMGLAMESAVDLAVGLPRGGLTTREACHAGLRWGSPRGLPRGLP